MPKLKPGDLFQNRYQIISELGAGGMGLVFHATQTDADRAVALKLMRSDQIKDKESVDRFYREFKLLSRLSHPHIMTLYGMSLDDDSLPYAVCEYIEGESLRSLLNREGALPWQRVARIVLQCASALQYAHEQSVVHRDLKPDNIMLLQVPEPDYVKLVDFGLSRALYDSTDLQKLTTTGQLIGSANYMSPELIRAKADARSDIYSLGCVVFELLSGEHLFDADAAVGIVFRHCNEDAQERLNDLKTDVPARLLSILKKMLEKDPEQRQKSMQVVADEWQSLLSDPGPMRKHARASDLLFRSPGVLATIAALVLVLPCAALIAFQSFDKSRSKFASPRAEKHKEILPRTLPRLGEGMVNLIRAQSNHHLQSTLATRWLELHLNRNDCAAKDKILVLNQLAKTEGARQRGVQEGSAWEKSFNLSSQLSNSDEDILLRYHTIDMFAEFCRSHGQKDKASSLALSVIDYCSKFDDRRVFLNVSQSSIITLLYTGKYKEALAAEDLFAKKYELRDDWLFARVFYSLHGDAQACNGMAAEALQNYLNAYETAEGLKSPERQAITAVDHARRIERVTGVATQKNAFVFKGSDIMVLVTLARRVAMLDSAEGRKQLEKIVQLAIQSQQNILEQCQRSGKNFQDEDILHFEQWLDLSSFAATISLPETAMTCSQMALNEVRLLPKSDERDRMEQNCLGLQALRLMQYGHVQEAEKIIAELEKDSSKAYTNKVSAITFWSQLARIALTNAHRTDLANRYYHIAQVLSVKAQALRQPDVFMCTEIALTAHVFKDSSTEDRNWKVVLARLHHFVPEPYDLISDNPYPQLGVLVSALLQCGKGEKVREILNSNAIQMEPRKLAKAIVLSERAPYELRHRDYVAAIKDLEEARMIVQQNYAGEREKEQFHLPRFLVVNLNLCAAKEQQKLSKMKG